LPQLKVKNVGSKKYFIKMGCSAKKFIISGFQKHVQKCFSMHISIC
jgi:hypothetical protein